jgi:hypothetical protein
VLFSALAGRKLQKRRDAWLREFAEVVQWLSEHGLDSETLANNDPFDPTRLMRSAEWPTDSRHQA